jgi:hypothetical protein
VEALMQKCHFTAVTIWRRGGWFRIFGYGLWFGIDHQPLFSERYGFDRVYRIGRLAVKVLKP